MLKSLPSDLVQTETPSVQSTKAYWSIEKKIISEKRVGARTQPIGGGPIEADRTLHVLVEGGDDCQELWREASLLEDLEEPPSSHQFKGFGEIHEGEEQWLLLLLTLLLQLTEGEDRVHCGPPGSEATV